MNGKIFRRRKSVFLLQPRDASIIKTVFHWRFLTSGQIRHLCGFRCRKRANDRLRKLFDSAYLSRRAFVNPYRKELLYFAGPKSTEFMAGETGTDPLQAGKKRAKVLKTRDSFISHFLAINEFRFSLEMAGRSDSRMEINVWKYKPPLFLDEEPKIFPDAYLFAKCGGKDQICFLEIDRSIESRKRIGKKVGDYLDYGLNGGCEKQFGAKYFRLLIICKTRARLETLSRIIIKTTDKSFCWLTEEKNVSPERILSPVWTRPNREGVFSLL